jgi:V/A-type H+-transporting ATPase subunit I
MFYPEEMSQVRLIIPAKDLLAVTKELARQGVFHQIDEKNLNSQKNPGGQNSWAEKAAAYATLERRILGIMQVLNIGPVPTSQGQGAAITNIDTIQPKVAEIDQTVRQTREQLADEQKHLEQLENIASQIEPLAENNINLDVLRNSEYVVSILGVIPTANIDRLQTSLEKTPHVLISLKQENQRTVAWLAGSKRNADTLERAARSAYLNPLILPEAYQGSSSDILTAIQADIQHAQEQITRLNGALSQLAGKYRNELQTLLWQTRVSRILTAAIGRYGQFRYTYVILGWVPSSQIEQFSEQMKKVAPNIVTETVAQKRGMHAENVPVALKNPRLIRPFQEFVTNYGRPLYGEVDPTFLLAITFPFLFGAMFGDLGQGVILTLLGLLLSSRKVKALKSMSALGGIVIACGIFAMIFGVLYGSVFGFEDKIPALIFRPMDNPLTTLAVAIAIGVVILSIGYLINILNKWTSKEMGELLFGSHGLSGLVLYWSLIGLALEVMLGKHPIPFVVFGIMALLAAVGVMFSESLIHLIEGHQPLIEGGVAIYAFRSVFELFEVLISMLSNTISYVRVGAFAVAHVGLESVFFILAGLISASHGAGYWITLIIGNIFIIGFEGMIVGIQTMRLSYYEFFNRFFAAGGMRYEPLTLQPETTE